MNKITVEQFVMELKRWYDDNLIKYLPDIVTDRFYEVLAKASEIAEPTVDADFWTELNTLYEKSLYNHEIALKVVGAFDVKDLLLKYKPKPPVNDKPKTYEEWRSTLSPEEQDESDRELARLVREHESDKPTESLAELADRKGMKINISRSKKEWSIGIRHKGTGTDKKGPIIAYHSMIYEGIEIYARAYLETLEDRRMEK